MSDQENFDDDAFSEDEGAVATKESSKKAPRKKAVKPDKSEEYRKEMSRRWRCQVNSMRKGVQHFELVVPHPSNPNKPVVVRGHCGVIIEDGLTKYVIEQLNSEYHNELVEVPTPMNPTGEDQGLNHKAVRVHHYQVQVFEEIKNPKPLGTVK